MWSWDPNKKNQETTMWNPDPQETTVVKLMS